MKNLPANGRPWAAAAFVLGVAVSVAANVAHTYHVPGVSGRPPIGAQVAAAFYPLALLLVVEILARVPWPAAWPWKLARYGGALTVAAVAAIVSYRHMSALLIAYGEDRITATIGPLAVDGLVVVSSLGLLAIGRQASVIAEPAAAPAVATGHESAPETVTPDGTAGQSAPKAAAPAAARLGDITEDVEAARDRFADVLAAGGLPSVRALRRELRVGHPKAVRVRAALAESATESAPESIPEMVATARESAADREGVRETAPGPVATARETGESGRVSGESDESALESVLVTA